MQTVLLSLKRKSVLCLCRTAMSVTRRNGEFGRTPDTSKDDLDGRDHNAKGYTMFLAGGGVKGGFQYGATDELGCSAVAGRMHLHELHATVLHLMGLDHTRLTYRYGGRDFRLTDVFGRVIEEVLA